MSQELQDQLDLANSRIQSVHLTFMEKTNEALELRASNILIASQKAKLMQDFADTLAEKQKIIDELQALLITANAKVASQANEPDGA